MPKWALNEPHDSPIDVPDDPVLDRQTERLDELGAGLTGASDRFDRGFWIVVRIALGVGFGVLLALIAYSLFD